MHIVNNPAKPLMPNAAPCASTVRPRLQSEKLLQGAPAVEIEHAGQYYLLRVTRENKLILTK